MITLEHDDITSMIFKALKVSGQIDRLLSLNLADKVLYRLRSWNGSQARLNIQDVNYMIKYVFNECGYTEAAKNIVNVNSLSTAI